MFSYSGLILNISEALASPALVGGFLTTETLRKKLKKLYTPNSDLEISFGCGMKNGLRENMDM